MLASRTPTTRRVLTLLDFCFSSRCFLCYLFRVELFLCFCSVLSSFVLLLFRVELFLLLFHVELFCVESCAFLESTSPS
jgi:hypothetical protein